MKSTSSRNGCTTTADYILNNTFKIPTEPFDATKPISESHISLAPLAATFT